MPALEVLPQQPTEQQGMKKQAATLSQQQQPGYSEHPTCLTQREALFDGIFPSALPPGRQGSRSIPVY